MTDLFNLIDESPIDGYGSANPNKKMDDYFFKFEAKTKEDMKFFDQANAYFQEYAIAEELSNRKHHSERKQDNIKKRTLDSATGKLGEFLVYKFLKEWVEGLQKPDCNIYVSESLYESSVRKAHPLFKKRIKEGTKEHGPDLISSHYHISVKTQHIDSLKRNGSSWVYQEMDSDKDPYMYNPPVNGITIYTIVDIEKRTFYIKGIFKSSEIIPFFDTPKKSDLIGVKKVVYWEDPTRRNLQKGFSEDKLKPLTKKDLLSNNIGISSETLESIQ